MTQIGGDANASTGARRVCGSVAQSAKVLADPPVYNPLMSARKRPAAQPPPRKIPTPPVGEPIANLSPSAQRLLTAAQRILAREGFAGLTLEALQAESGMNKSAVWYHFGGKPGLVAALVDVVEQEESRRLLDEVEKGTGLDERLEAFAGAQGQLERHADRYAQFFELLPHVLRDDELRATFARQMAWYREADRTVLAPEDASLDDPTLEALSALTVAVEDGLAIQHAADPTVDLSAALSLWKRLIRIAVDEVRRDTPDSR